MAFELLLRSGCDDQISYLRRKKPAQLAHPLDFADLVRDTLFKLLVQLVEIVEQPRILDGDNSLGGKILNKIDLLFGKRAYFLAVDYDHTDEFVFLQHRYGDVRSRTAQFNHRI